MHVASFWADMHAFCIPFELALHRSLNRNLRVHRKWEALQQAVNMILAEEWMWLQKQQLRLFRNVLTPLVETGMHAVDVAYGPVVAELVNPTTRMHLQLLNDSQIQYIYVATYQTIDFFEW